MKYLNIAEIYSKIIFQYNKKAGWLIEAVPLKKEKKRKERKEFSPYKDAFKNLTCLAIILEQLLKAHLQDRIFSVVLVAHAEQFTMYLAGAEAQLHLGGVFVRLEGQRVFDVTLRLECSRYRRRHAAGAGPARIALTSRLSEATHAGAVLPATECRLLVITDLLGLWATSDAVTRQARMR